MAVWRIVVADDDTTFRAALVHTLERDPRFDVVGSVASGEELWEVAERTHPHVALIDLRMPQGGTAAVRGLRERMGDVLVIVVVSAHESASDLISLLRAGVTGYLVKGRLSGGALPDLVARCASGEVVLAAPLAGRALRRLLATDDQG